MGHPKKHSRQQKSTSKTSELVPDDDCNVVMRNPHRYCALRTIPDTCNLPLILEHV